MKHPYHQFTVQDFVLDDAFRRWVFEPDEQNMTFWHTFMFKHPEQQAIVDEAASLLLHLRANYDDLTDASQQRIYQILERAFDESKRADTFSTETPVRPLRQHHWTWHRSLAWRVAASLTGLILLAGGAIWYIGQPKQLRIHTAFGESRSVILPDGSTVLLNGNSTLLFTDVWSTDKPREVWLDGEGFFKVTKKRRLNETGYDATRVKFITHTPGLDITVLGTQFNVNTRRGSTAVTLLEGRVQLSKPGIHQNRVIDMKPGQHALAQPNVANVEVRDERPQLHTSWIDHQFVFDNTTLSDIAQQLNDTYGLTLVFEDSGLADRRFTGNLSNQSIETLLTTISITFDLEVRRTGDQIVLQRAH